MRAGVNRTIVLFQSASTTARWPPRPSRSATPSAASQARRRRSHEPARPGSSSHTPRLPSRVLAWPAPGRQTLTTVLGGAHVVALSSLVTARAPPKPPAWRLPDHVGELGRLADEQLAELVSEPLVADGEITKDLRGDRVVVGAQCEQHVLGRGDRAAMTQPSRLVARGLQDALGARRDPQ